ncbi:MAG: Rieske (2Fe-2S) protein [Cyanobacteria bacterium P01_E01_bin.6]
MKRRDFNSLVGLGLLASSMPIALAACNQQSPDGSSDTSTNSSTTESPSSETTASTDEFAAVGSVSELDSRGSLLKKGLAVGHVIAIRDPANSANIIALDSRCTHQQCDVEWESGDTQFYCPCHGSTFAPDGSVTNGPATTALPSYEAKIEGDQVVVKAI